MGKIENLIKPLLLLTVFFSYSCAPAVIARLSGTVGDGISAIYANVGFDTLTDTATGSGESASLTLKFSNASGEFFQFVLSPSNTSGSSFSTLFGSTNYNIDGVDNHFDGSVLVGTSSQGFRASSGTLDIEGITFSGSVVVSLGGAFQIFLENGGYLEGTFGYTASQ